MTRIRDILLNRDVIGGLLFVVLGGATMVIGSSYALGTPMRMGPGYFPLLIGGLIAALGLLLAVTAMIRAMPEGRISAFDLKPLIFILAAITAFALLIDRLGLVVAVSALVLIARLSRIEGRLGELILSLVIMNVIAYLVFIYGLNMPLKVSPL